MNFLVLLFFHINDSKEDIPPPQLQKTGGGKKDTCFLKGVEKRGKI